MGRRVHWAPVCGRAVCARGWTDWLPWTATRLIKTAVRKLPLAAQKWYTEEWLVELDQLPGKLSKLVGALRIRFKARATSKALDGNKNPLLSATRVPIWIKTVAVIPLVPFIFVTMVFFAFGGEKTWPEDEPAIMVVNARTAFGRARRARNVPDLP